jgi:hypothetical protein
MNCLQIIIEELDNQVKDFLTGLRKFIGEYLG